MSGYPSEAFHDDDHDARTLTKILDDAAASNRLALSVAGFGPTE